MTESSGDECDHCDDIFGKEDEPGKRYASNKLCKLNCHTLGICILVHVLSLYCVARRIYMEMIFLDMCKFHNLHGGVKNRQCPLWESTSHHLLITGMIGCYGDVV